MHFRERNVLYFDWNFTEVCSLVSNWLSIGLGNGLVPNRWQAIIWTTADPIHWRIYAGLGGDELITSGVLLKVNTCVNDYNYISDEKKIIGTK